VLFLGFKNDYAMKTTLLKILPACFALLIFAALMFSTEMTMAQETTEPDTTKAVQDNSSSFNDSVQFDDMEPIFYEATEDEAAEKPAEGGSSNLALYGGIIVALIIVLVVLKKVSKKTPTKS
jgi:hypothetical protein